MSDTIERIAAQGQAEAAPDIIKQAQNALTPERVNLLQANAELEQAIANVLVQFRSMGDAIDQRSVSNSFTRFQEGFFWLNNSVVAGQKDN